MYRKERIADLLQSFLAEELRRSTDPKLSFVTLTEVRPSKDYKAAKVFWSIPAAVLDDSRAQSFPSEAQRKEVAEALEGVRKHLKKRIGEELELRFVPELNFVYDSSAETGSRIDQLLKQAGYPDADV